MPPLILPTAAILLASVPHHPPPTVVPLPGPIQALAATDTGVVVVTGPEVRMFDHVGHPLRTLWRRDIGGRSPSVDRERSAETSPVPGPTADSGWTVSHDPDDTDRQDDPRLVDDAPGAEQPRRGIASGPALEPGPMRSPVVAATGDHAWIAQTDGLWKVDLASGAQSRVLRSRGTGIRLLAVSPDGGTLAFVEAGELLLSRDGGNTFQATGPVAGTVRALATTRAGVVFMLGKDNLRVIRPERDDATMVDLGRVSDVASCGQEVLVLANGALHSIVDPTAPLLAMKRVSAAPFGTEGITCHASGSPWILRGSALWTSGDRGESWTRRSDLPPSRIVGAAVTAMAIWVATPSNLVALPTSAPLERPSSSTERRNPRASALPVSLARRAVADRSPPHPRWWQIVLPRIDLSFTARQTTTSATQTTTRRELCGWIVATFTLDRPRHAPRRGQGQEGLGPHLATTWAPEARSAIRMGPDVPKSDPITTEERQALARILEEHP